MSTVLYSDGCISLDDNGLTIHRYYFPLASSKRISYRDIRRVTVEQMTWMNGKGRLWGATDPRAWMPLDWRRTRKEKLLVFDVGSKVKPCVSPDDPDRVMDLLRAHAPDAVDA